MSNSRIKLVWSAIKKTIDVFVTILGSSKKEKYIEAK